MRTESVTQGAATAPLPDVLKSRAVVLSSNEARAPSRLLLLRLSLGVKLEVGAWWFNGGEVLSGVIVTHPVNAARKVIIQTNRGTFSLNEEDVEEF